MERLITINNTESIERYEDSLPIIDSGDYIVDDSCFIPMSEAIRQLEVSSTSDNVVDSYDFVDGVDDGRAIPISRRKSIKDIAEVSTEIMNDINTISEKISKNKQKAAEMASFEAELKSAGTKSESATE